MSPGNRSLHHTSHSFPSVCLWCLRGVTRLHHNGLRPARKVSCLLLLLARCLFGGKAIHIPPLTLPETLIPSQGPACRLRSVHIYVCTVHMPCFPTGKINLYDGSGMELSAFQALNDYVWLLSVLPLSCRNM